MDAPPIQYAKAADGVSIAYWVIGEGPPLVVQSSLNASHIQMEWEWNVRRTAYERLSQRSTLIRYDCRGAGLSQRDCADFSADAAVLDLEAVVDRLGLERFAIFGSQATGNGTLAFPARHPERVSHLIIGVTGFPPGFARRLSVIERVYDEDWELYVENWTRILLGWDNPQAGEVAAMVKVSHTPASFRLALQAMATYDPQPYLAAIKAPTLILHPKQSETAGRRAQALAAGIAGAHMLAIPGWPLGYTAMHETAVGAILDFINAQPASPGAAIPPPKIDVSAVRTIVFTDVEGSTALNERLGDEGARGVLREHKRLTREALGAHGGSEVKAMGDGFMAWFPSATRAVECAIALQRAFAARNTSQPEPISVRIGINAGEPLSEGDDLFGASVITTARIAASASGGQILASDVVRQLLAGKAFAFTDQGEHTLKGFEEPVRLHEVRWREDA
jgi:class 3 adenylate cyclase/pimeloyl-ACP methyl ester carboxylesterase